MAQAEPYKGRIGNGKEGPASSMEKDLWGNGWSNRRGARLVAGVICWTTFCARSKSLQLMLKINLLILKQVIIVSEAGKKDYENSISQKKIQYSTVVWSQATWAWILAVPLSCSISLGESLSLSILICRMGKIIIIPAHSAFWRTELILVAHLE